MVQKKSSIKSKTGRPAKDALSVVKHPGGRPPKYSTPEELQSKIDEYFESCWFEKVTESQDQDTGKIETSVIRYQQRPYTIAGLAYDLDMSTEALRNYQDKPEFLAIVKKAKLKIEMNFEENLSGKNPAGSIFWLKNHAGYRDKQEVEFPDENGKPQKIGSTFSDTERSARLLFLLERAEKRAKQ